MRRNDLSWNHNGLSWTRSWLSDMDKRPFVATKVENELLQHTIQAIMASGKLSEVTTIAVEIDIQASKLYGIWLDHTPYYHLSLHKAAATVVKLQHFLRRYAKHDGFSSSIYYLDICNAHQRAALLAAAEELP